MGAELPCVYPSHSGRRCLGVMKEVGARPKWPCRAARMDEEAAIGQEECNGCRCEGPAYSERK